jgi:chemosensory pili system protein ChpA (sensor histidine kinase/response regulator)
MRCRPTWSSQVLQVREADLAAAFAAGSINVQGEPCRCATCLRCCTNRGASSQRSSPVLVLGSGGNTRVGVQVDEVLGNREVVIKNVGPQLARMPGIAGATVLGSGEIVLILNPLLLAGSGARPGRVVDTRPPAPTARVATIMVVDDSLTVRR